MKTLGRYKIGFIVLGVLTLALVVFVVIQAGATKQDAKTDIAANRAADTLSSYISNNETIPSSLSQAGVTDAPNTISYTKLSDASYKFCVTYKNNSSGFDAGNVTSELTSGDTVSNDTYDYSSSSYLYIPTTHHKGQNCQTIKPYIYSSGSLLPRSSCSYLSNICTTNNPDSGGSINIDTSAQAEARDTERENDMSALQEQLEAYFAGNGNYPTFADLNSATWRAQNMKTLNSSVIKDPEAANSSLAATPTKDAYSYQPMQLDGTACGNDETYCVSYTLTATLERGGTYTKRSLN